MIGLSKVGLRGLINKVIIESSKVLLSPLILAYIVGGLGVIYTKGIRKILVESMTATFILFHIVYWIYNATHFIFITALLTITGVYFIFNIIPEKICTGYSQKRINSILIKVITFYCLGYESKTFYFNSRFFF